MVSIFATPAAYWTHPLSALDTEEAEGALLQRWWRCELVECDSGGGAHAVFCQGREVREQRLKALDGQTALGAPRRKRPAEPWCLRQPARDGRGIFSELS
jgi:hypothetical protein